MFPMFITLEGLDGVGKSTQARLLAERLRAAGQDVVECREPGGTALGERVRSLVLDHGDWDVAPRAEALLFAASRAQLVADVIGPALARDAWVVCDRYLDSSVAFQGGGRGLGLDTIRDVSLFATDGLLPDRTIVLVGTPRAPEAADRIEVEGDGFRTAVTAAFAEVARREPGRVRLVDGAGDVATVGERVWKAVRA
jgi:dTMP kinase